MLVADAMVKAPTTHDPGSRVDEVRAFFEDARVHMALIVAADGRLLTTIERPDLDVAAAGSMPLERLGTLAGRTMLPSDALAAATATLSRQGRRRMAVVDRSGRLVGLLCLKRDRSGYCSDEGIAERATPPGGAPVCPGRALRPAGPRG